ncbi:MAG: hypothetical protein ABEJ95_04985 [Candidatus Nanohalobium sp.]
MESLTPEQFLEKYFDERPEEVGISESLQELKGSASEISEEEKERRRKEVEEMSSKELGEAFGLE